MALLMRSSLLPPPRFFYNPVFIILSLSPSRFPFVSKSTYYIKAPLFW